MQGKATASSELVSAPFTGDRRSNGPCTPSKDLAVPDGVARGSAGMRPEADGAEPPRVSRREKGTHAPGLDPSSRPHRRECASPQQATGSPMQRHDSSRWSPGELESARSRAAPFRPSGTWCRRRLARDGPPGECAHAAHWPSTRDAWCGASAKSGFRSPSASHIRRSDVPTQSLPRIIVGAAHPRRDRRQSYFCILT